MDECVKEKSNRRMHLTHRIGKLRADIEGLENNLVNGNNKFHDDFLAIEPSIEKADQSFPRQSRRPANISKLLDLSALTSGVKTDEFSRKLRFHPGELYQYDCLMECRTSSLKFIVKFVETVKGPGDECGKISSMEAEVIMSKGDPESLLDWISECCNAGDLAMLIHGLVEFTVLANNRRSILRTLFRREKSGQLGSSTLSIVGEEDGVMVIGIGPKNAPVFSIKWKIGYFHAMKSTFEINLHEKDLQYESAEVFAALQRPYLTEEDLPLLWEAVADTLQSCN